ncbi:ATP-binding protein [Streptomyces goshikiensis]|uniref:ATP-binding protein n=1 Tax=Streptomyces goshikiensis TaxID=1942 RepID=UPI0036C10571
MTSVTCREFLALLAFGDEVERVSIEVESRAGTVGQARHFVLQQLQPWGLAEDEDLGDRILLVVSELVTNAVLHGRTRPQEEAETLGLTLAWRRDCALGVMVKDNSSRIPTVRVRPSPSADGGRGLLLVTALSDGWTAAPRDGGNGGKALWAFFDCARPARLPELLTRSA